MKKFGTGVVLTLLALVVLIGAPPADADIICEPGAAFYGTDGQLLDCLQGGGESCMYCYETIIVPVHRK